MRFVLTATMAAVVSVVSLASLGCVRVRVVTVPEAHNAPVSALEWATFRQDIVLVLSDQHIGQERFNRVVDYFERITGIDAGLDRDAYGWIPDTSQLLLALERWQEWYETYRRSTQPIALRCKDGCVAPYSEEHQLCHCKNPNCPDG